MTVQSEHSPGLSRFFAQAAQLPLLTPEQEIALAKRVAAGDHEARNTLVLHNIRLAIKLAKNWRQSEVPFEDLVQDAVMGLHRAANKFDHKRGFRFSTYATWWVNHHLQRAVQNTGATIRTPGHISARRSKLARLLAENPDYTHEELAEILECEVHHIQEALEAAAVVASLDTMMENGETSAYEHIADPNSIQPDEMFIRDDRLREAMADLSELERNVLVLRFGFNGPVRSRDDIAAILGVQQHAVGSAQRRGLAKLRGLLADPDAV